MGVAWWDGKQVQVNTKFDPTLKNIEALKHYGGYDVLAHCRYSTSDINWPLPLMFEGSAYVMNGVISQEDPPRWPLSELEPYTTGNDTEIAHRFASYGMLGQHGGSFAIGRMNPDGGMDFWRNDSRPLWHMKLKPDAALVVSSTQDILRRSALPAQEAREVPPGSLWNLGLQFVPNEPDFDLGPPVQRPTFDPTYLKCTLP